MCGQYSGHLHISWSGFLSPLTTLLGAAGTSGSRSIQPQLPVGRILVPIAPKRIVSSLSLSPIISALENQSHSWVIRLLTLATLVGLQNSLNQSILAKAFRGELVPQDPNDEPASVRCSSAFSRSALPPREARRGGKRKISKRAASDEGDTPLKKPQAPSSKSASVHLSKTSSPSATPAVLGQRVRPLAKPARATRRKTQPAARNQLRLPTMEHDDDEMMALCRKVLRGQGEMTVDAFIKALSVALGHGRLSTGIRAGLEKHLRTAGAAV